jgi:PmbA protein
MQLNHEQLLELALRSGAEAAEVYSISEISDSVGFEANQLKHIESSESDGIALRLWKNQQPGIAVAFGEIEAQTLVDRALALSSLNQSEEIILNSGKIQAPNQGKEVEVSQLISWGEEAIAEICTSNSDLLCEGEWECGKESFRLINSRGLDCGYTDIGLSSYLTVEWIRDEDFLQIWAADAQRDRLTPQHLSREILPRLSWAKDSAESPTGKMPILFTAKAVEVLLGTIVEAMNAKQLEQNATPWSDRLNQIVVDSSITLSQIPNLAPFNLPFDDEGTTTQAFNWIDKGVLRGFFSDRRLSQKFNLPLLGNGFRSDLGNQPNPGLFNLVVSPGNDSFEQLLQTMGNGLIVDQILGDGGGLAGDFSFNLELGYLVRQGEIIGRVKDTMVSGNAYQALRENIQLGAESQWHGSLYTPALLVSGLDVTC